KSLLAALESFCDEWLQHPILLVSAVEEGADMTLCAKHGAGEPDRLVTLTRGSAANIGLIIDGIHRVLLSLSNLFEFPVVDHPLASILQLLGQRRIVVANEYHAVCCAHAPVSLPIGTVN